MEELRTCRDDTPPLLRGSRKSARSFLQEKDLEWPPSPPARGRGLKPLRRSATSLARGSPPARGRGLKQEEGIVLSAGRVSPPARGRGLKLTLSLDVGSVKGVAPRAGAWIETTY